MVNDTQGAGVEQKGPKSTKSPAFQFYPRDFLSSGKVDQMPMTERGAYITLLSRCWLDNGLPLAMPELAAMVRMRPSAFEKMWKNSQIGKCFAVRAGRFHNDRLDHEREVQSAHSKKQKANADKRWESHGNATAVPDGDTSHASGNALRSLPLLQSASASAQQGGAPLHQSHRSHAACGRVCVPATLHGEFVRRRNTPAADAELRAWYGDVQRAWMDGPHATVEPGEPFAFWRARYAEQWPAANSQAARDNRPAWVQRAKGAIK